jgi:hypothetical protein
MIVVPKHRKHTYRRDRYTLKAQEYPFKKMLVTDYFEDGIEFYPSIRKAAYSASKKLAPREFDVTIVDEKVVCTRIK